MFFHRYLLSKWPNENQQQESRKKFAVAGLHKASNGGCVRAVGLYKGCGVKSGGVPRRCVADCIHLGPDKVADTFLPLSINES